MSWVSSSAGGHRRLGGAVALRGCPSHEGRSRPGGEQPNLSPDPLVEVHLAQQPFHGRQHGRVQLEQLAVGVGHEEVVEPGACLVEALESLAQGLDVGDARRLRRVGLVLDQLPERRRRPRPARGTSGRAPGARPRRSRRRASVASYVASSTARNIPRIATAECSSASSPCRSPGPTSGVPRARTLSRRPCSAWTRAAPIRWDVVGDPTRIAQPGFGGGASVAALADSSASSSAARLSSSPTESASPSMARPASAVATFGGNSRFAATPTAAPTSVSAMRCQAADSAPSEPTPSTSMPLIATSIRFARRRSTWPIVMETRMSRPRLHHSSGTTSREGHRDEDAGDHRHDPVDAAGEQRDRGDLHDEHRGQRCEQRLRAREEQRRHDVARDRGDRDPQRPEHRRAAVVPEPRELAGESRSPPVGHTSSSLIPEATASAASPAGRGYAISVHVCQATLTILQASGNLDTWTRNRK